MLSFLFYEVLPRLLIGVGIICMLYAVYCFGKIMGAAEKLREKSKWEHRLVILFPFYGFPLLLREQNTSAYVTRLLVCGFAFIVCFVAIRFINPNY